MKGLCSSTDMANTASMALFKQGRRLGSKAVKFPFYKTTGLNHCTFVLLPPTGPDCAVHASDRGQGRRGVEMNWSLNYSMIVWKVSLYNISSYNRLDSSGLMVGLDDLKGLFQPKWFYESDFSVFNFFFKTPFLVAVLLQLLTKKVWKIFFFF